MESFSKVVSSRHTSIQLSELLTSIALEYFVWQFMKAQVEERGSIVVSWIYLSCIKIIVFSVDIQLPGKIICDLPNNAKTCTLESITNNLIEAYSASSITGLIYLNSEAEKHWGLVTTRVGDTEGIS